MIGVWREDSTCFRDRRADLRSLRFTVLAIRAQESDSLSVERDASLLVRLGVLLPSASTVLRDAGANPERCVVEVKPIPAERAQLASASASRHR